MKVVVRRRAIRQVDAISRYIAVHRPIAAVAFEEAFQDMVRRLGEHPLSSPLISRANLRQATMTRFPYVIVYRVEAVEVTILGVFHAARDPSVRSRA